jgi:hypothetical protein
MSDFLTQLNIQQYQSQRTASPGDSGAGGGHIKNTIEGGIIGALFGLKEAPGLLQGTQGFFEKKMVSWGNPRNQGPFAKALSEAFATLKQGGNNLMEGVAAPLSNGTENGYGYHEGQGINFSEVDSSSAIAPSATPAVGGMDFEPSFSPA